MSISKRERISREQRQGEHIQAPDSHRNIKNEKYPSSRSQRINDQENGWVSIPSAGVWGPLPAWKLGGSGARVIRVVAHELGRGHAHHEKGQNGGGKDLGHDVGLSGCGRVGSWMSIGRSLTRIYVRHKITYV